jgi:environmental stress-induced protein Ves
MRLVIGSEPHAFPADTVTSATLIGGTVIDFNVMSRRGKVKHKMERLRNGRFSPAGSTRLVLCTTGFVGIESTTGYVHLARYDAALLSRDDAAELVPDTASEFYVAEFRPA